MMADPKALGDVELAELCDAAEALLHLLCDTTITCIHSWSKENPYRNLSLPPGRRVAIVPRTLAPAGYMDLERDDPSSGTALMLEEAI